VSFTEQYDVVVVGAGHAGCEAAMAAARMGLRTAIFTLNLDLIAQMSCNPAIGGIAKGHLVREVDALGGVMGEVADACGIQFRLLNTSRGPAVWSPRAQCDKALYRVKMREVLEGQKNLFIKQAEVVDLIVEEVGDPTLRSVTPASKDRLLGTPIQAERRVRSLFLFLISSIFSLARSLMFWTLSVVLSLASSARFLISYSRRSVFSWAASFAFPQVSFAAPLT